MYQRFFGKYISGDLPPLKDLIHNVSLALVNSDGGFHGPRAFLPNVIEIGGLHVAHQPAKTLPKDVTHYFSIAEDGIFLFTLGASTKPSKIFSNDKLAAMNHVFRTLPTAAAFVRWDDRVMEHQSDNVVIGLYMPQKDMLGELAIDCQTIHAINRFSSAAAPNLRLLITNGGLLSIYEAIYYKKPIIGMPLSGDQFQNIALVEHHKIGRTMHVDNITVDSFREILTDVRTNPIYQENIERLHDLIFTVNPTKNKLEKVLSHIEYVIETKGAAHLKSTTALSMSVWQLYLVDVIVTLILIVFLILALPAVVIGIILRRANARIVSYDGDVDQQRATRTWDSNDVVKVSPKSSTASTPSSSQETSGKGTLKKRN